jgi:predicted TIM-barrel fold metal-dependent hydrolase
MKPYFEMRDRDRSFYEEYLKPRLPARIFDVHVHCNLPAHVAMVPEERWLSDWAMECGHILPAADALSCARELFPDAEYAINAFPMPVREADLRGNNEYLAQEQREGRISAFMCVTPQWDDGYLEQVLVQNEFLGVKPYPDMVSGVKGADISIFDFMPHSQWALVNRLRRTVMLHLPRKERFADDMNVEELLEIRQKYPELCLIIAHFGRSFCPYYLEEGLKKMGGAGGFHFDTAAVLNPAVYDIAFSRLDSKQILFGTDMPICLFHGKREWKERTYINLSSDDFAWNTNRRSPEEEAGYTLFVYEQVRAILDAMDRIGFTDAQKEDIFFRNGKRLLGRDV